MGLLEWIGAHLLGPVVNLWRAINARPRPDIRILELKPVGGASEFVDFNVQLANYGTQQCRCELTARVGDESVECRPGTLDLIPDEPPKRARVLVPRRRLGELMTECNGATTLYGETLYLSAVAGKRRADKLWHDDPYDPKTDRVRHGIQQRYWRRGRGEETEDDLRGEAIREAEKKAEPPDRFMNV